MSVLWERNSSINITRVCTILSNLIRIEIDSLASNIVHAGRTFAAIRYERRKRLHPMSRCAKECSKIFSNNKLAREGWCDIFCSVMVDLPKLIVLRNAHTLITTCI